MRGGEVADQPPVAGAVLGGGPGGHAAQEAGVHLAVAVVPGGAEDVAVVLGEGHAPADLQALERLVAEVADGVAVGAQGVGDRAVLVEVALVAVDVGVLMVTIWSFHIQYGQPAAFYLKAPTLLYIFIFIALRALSLAPGYVLFAGVAAAGGWLALLAYALAEPGGMGLLTRDYVAYMTSARILIGGEVDKVLSILVTAVLLTVATARPGHTTDEIQKVIDEELDRLRREPPDRRELERVINQIEASFYRGMERVGGFGGIADQLNAYYVAGGGPDFFAEDLARYTSLVPADIQAAVLGWLPPDRRVELIVTPAVP